MPRSINRRNFLKVIAGACGTALLGFYGLQNLPAKKFKTFSGKMLGPSAATGHRIRDHRLFPTPQKSIETDVVIVGGGISGLSAGWWLKKQGFDRFMLLEMEQGVGGNSRSGKNAISAFPWGAHYVPLPGSDAKFVRMLFEELGVIRGYDAQARPIYDELYLCHEPDERLLKDGRWQEGLVPMRGTTEADQSELERFFKQIDDYKNAIGADDKRAFAVPLVHSSQDRVFRELDQISMAQWMKQEGFHSTPLNWYVTYCCRDDYGATPDQVSAWAGIHYFASRAGDAANADSQAVVTWPEGNGWLVSRLKEKIESHIQTQAAVYRIDSDTAQTQVDYIDHASGQAIRIQAKYVIFAGPRFVAQHIVSPLQKQRPAYLRSLTYAPWLVANVNLKKLPENGEGGAPISWDNVSYHNQSLGYVVATHQNISQYPGKTVLTYYRPLTHLPPRLAREEAAKKQHADWTAMVVNDLKGMHPSIEPDIETVDVWVWGHGMIRPSVGFIWGAQRQEMLKPIERIYFAHSDMSGISIFEEAQHHGVTAAQQVLSQLRVTA